MTPDAIVERATKDGLAMKWIIQNGAVKISVTRPATMVAVPTWLIEEKTTWDPEGIRQAIMESGGRKAVPLTAADVVRRCRQEGIRLTRETTIEGEPTVGVTMPEGQDLPMWLRAWALFNPTAGRATLLNLTEDDVADRT